MRAKIPARVPMPRWAGVVNHGSQHLGGGNHRLGRLVGLLDQHLLDARHAFNGDLNAQISAGNHDAVRLIENGVDRTQ